MDDVFSLSGGNLPPSSQPSVTMPGGSSFTESVIVDHSGSTSTLESSSPNSNEVQRLLRENKRFRQENLALKVELERFRLQGRKSASTGMSDPMKEADTPGKIMGSNGSGGSKRTNRRRGVEGEEKDEREGGGIGEASDGAGRASSADREDVQREKRGDGRRGKDKKEEQYEEMVSQLKAEIQQLTSRNRQLQEGLGTSTLVYTEREHVFGKLYYDVQVELEALREENNDLRVLLKEARGETSAKVESFGTGATTSTTANNNNGMRWSAPSLLPLSTSTKTTGDGALVPFSTVGSADQEQNLPYHSRSPGRRSGGDDICAEGLLRRMQQEISTAFHRIASSIGLPWEEGMREGITAGGGDGGGPLGPGHTRSAGRRKDDIHGGHTHKKGAGSSSNRKNQQGSGEVSHNVYDNSSGSTSGTHSSMNGTKGRAIEQTARDGSHNAWENGATGPRRGETKAEIHGIRDSTSYEVDEYNHAEELRNMPKLFREQLEREREIVLASTDGLRIPTGAGVLRAPPRKMSKGTRSVISSKSSTDGAGAATTRKRGRPRTLSKTVEEGGLDHSLKRDKSEPAQESENAHQRRGMLVNAGDYDNKERRGGDCSSLDDHTEVQRKTAPSIAFPSTTTSPSFSPHSPSAGVNSSLKRKMVSQWTSHCAEVEGIQSSSGSSIKRTTGAIDHCDGSYTSHIDHAERTSCTTPGEKSFGMSRRTPLRLVSMEEYIEKACQSSTSSASSSPSTAVYWDQEEVFPEDLSSKWSEMAEDIPKILFKVSCYPSMLDPVSSTSDGNAPHPHTLHHREGPHSSSPGSQERRQGSSTSSCFLPHHLPSSSSSSSTLGMPNAMRVFSSSQFSSWTMLWACLSTCSIENRIWHAIRAVRRLNHSDLLLALKSALFMEILALMQRLTESELTALEPRKNDDSDTREDQDARNTGTTTTTATTEEGRGETPVDVERESPIKSCMKAGSAGEERKTREERENTRLLHGARSLSFSTMVCQMYTLATALNFLWLQEVLEGMEKVFEGNSLDPTTKNSSLPCASNIHTTPALANLKERVSTIREDIVQLLMDMAVIALKGWHCALSLPFTSSLAFSSCASEGNAMDDEDVRACMEHTNEMGNPHAAACSRIVLPPAMQARSSLLFLWMTFLRALLGRTLPRHLRLRSFVSSPCALIQDVYDELFLYDVVLPSFGLPDLVFAWKNRSHEHGKGEAAASTSNAPTTVAVSGEEEEEKRSSAPSSFSSSASSFCFSSFLPYPTNKTSSSFRTVFHAHGLMIYALKSILAACLTNLVKDFDSLYRYPPHSASLTSRRPSSSIPSSSPAPSQGPPCNADVLRDSTAVEVSEKAVGHDSLCSAAMVKDGLKDVEMNTQEENEEKVQESGERLVLPGSIPPEQEEQHKHAWGVWLDFTGSIGWSVAVCSLQEITQLAVSLTLSASSTKERFPSQRNIEPHQTTSGNDHRHGRSLSMEKLETGKEEDRGNVWNENENLEEEKERRLDNHHKAQEIEIGSKEKNPEEEDVSTLSCSPSFAPSPPSLSPLSSTEQDRALLQWEKKSGAALLALRFIVLFKGFEFIATDIQPLIQAELQRQVDNKLFHSEIMSNTLFSIVPPPLTSTALTTTSASTTSASTSVTPIPRTPNNDVGDRHHGGTARGCHRGDDLMAYILSSAILDMDLVIKGEITNVLSSPSSIPAYAVCLTSATSTSRIPSSSLPGSSVSSSCMIKCAEEGCTFQGDIHTNEENRAADSARLNHYTMNNRNEVLPSSCHEAPAQHMSHHESMLLSSSAKDLFLPTLTLPRGEQQQQHQEEQERKEDKKVILLPAEEKERIVVRSEKQGTEVERSSVYVHVLEFLHQYLQTTIMRPPSRTPTPLALISHTQLLALSGIIQLLRSGCRRREEIQHYLLPSRSWMMTGVRKMAAQNGFAVSENVKQVIDLLVHGRDSPWGTRRGRWILEILLPS